MGLSPIWNLLAESGIVSNARATELAEEFQRSQPPNVSLTNERICEWLVSSGVASKYQVTVLQAGHAGPFDYLDYRVDDRHTSGIRKGTFRAIHKPTGVRTLLRFGDASLPPSQWNAIRADISKRAEIEHPNLITIHESVDLDQFRFVVMDDFDGVPLLEALGEKKTLSSKRSCRMIYQVASALAAIQEAGFVHGDLRPENVFVNASGQIRVWWDPLAPSIPLDQHAATSPDDAVERARSICPEGGAPGAVPSPLFDVYAIGCLFYTLLSGKRPFAGDSVEALLKQHAEMPTAPLSEVGVPKPLEKMIAYMMAKRADIRTANAHQVALQVKTLMDAAKTAPTPTIEFDQKARGKFRGLVLKRNVTERATPETAAPPLVTNNPTTSQPAPTVSAPIVSAPAIAAPPSEATKGDIKIDIPASSGSVQEMGQPLIAPDSDLSAVSRARSRRSKSVLPFIIGGALLVVVAAVGVGIAIFGNGSNSDNDQQAADSDSDPDNSTNPTSTGTTQTSAQLVAFEQEVVDDDGVLLWETPTAGHPIELDYMPPGLRILVAVRPSEMFANDEGELIRQSLGANLVNQIDGMESQFGVQANDIEQLLIGYHDNEGQAPRPSFRIRLNEPVSRTDLIEAWQTDGPTGDQIAGRDSYHGGSGWSYLDLSDPDGDTVDSFLVCDPRDLSAVIENAGSAPLVNRELRQLLRYSDRERHVSIASVPSAMFNDEGRKLFGSGTEEFVDGLDELIGDSVGAVMLSAHFESDFYLEVMLKGTLDIEPARLKDGFASRLKSAVDETATFVFTLGSSPYWDQIRMKYASWMSELIAGTRFGVEQRIVIANCWLPQPAAHNLLIASELSLASLTGTPTTVIDTPETDDTPPENIDELLATEMTLSIPRNDLVLIVDEIKSMVADRYPALSFPFDIRLMGPELRLQAITQNQSVTDFEMVDVPLSEILTGLIVKAYAPPGVDGPSDPNWQLIWAKAPDPDNPDNTIVLMTTRVAADRDGITLPEVFQTQQ